MDNRVAEFEAFTSQAMTWLARGKAKNERIMELLAELKSLGLTKGLTEGPDVISPLSRLARTHNKRTTVLRHKVAAGEVMKSQLAETKKVPDNLTVWCVRFLDVLNLGEQTTDDTLATLERAVNAARKVPGKKPSKE